MAILLRCSCGKGLRVKDEMAGRRIKCPACGGPVTVPAPDLEEVETVAAEKPKRKREGGARDEPVKKKKKKKSKKGVTPLTKEEKEAREFERETERRQMVRHTIESFAYLILGLIITGAAAFGLIAYSDTLWSEDLTYAAMVVIILLIGIGGTVKGALGLASIRNFIADDEDDL